MMLNEKISDLLEMELVGDDDKVIFTDEAKALIHEIAEECNMKPIVKWFEGKTEKYVLEKSPEDIYIDMLLKIACAPTSVHAAYSAILLIPVIDRKIREEESVGRAGTDSRGECQ